MTGQHGASNQGAHRQLIVDDTGSPDGHDDQLRDAAIKERRGLRRLPSQNRRHRCLGDRLLQPLETALHLRLHGHDLDGMNASQDLGNEIIFSVVLRCAIAEDVAEFAAAMHRQYGKNGK